MAGKKNQRGLGRGLSALLADVELDQAEVQPSEASKAETSSAQNPEMLPPEMLPIEYLIPNQNQPRRSFGDEELKELAASIGEKGIVQPIIVRKLAEDKYQIVAGERRWRAAQMAKLHLVPVVLRDYNDAEVQEIALIENIQRQDLNVMEEARAYSALMKEHGHTQEQLSKALGKSRSHIANILRLLNLPEPVRKLVRDGKLSMGHARALLASSDPSAAANQALANGWSVRDLENFVKNQASGEESSPKAVTKPKSGKKDADTKQLERELTSNLGMKLSISHGDAGSGTLSIQYKSLEELDKLCKLLGK